MKRTETQRFIILVGLILAGLLLFGCAGKEIPIWGNEEVGFNLQYRLDDGQKLNYEMSSKTKSDFNLMGNSTLTDEDALTRFSLVGTQTDSPDNLSGQVTVDDMTLKEIQSAMGESGEMERDLSKVIGKTFTLTFSPLGREIDFAGVEKMTIDMGQMGGGEQSVRDRFRDLLIDLSNNPVKIGETWTSTVEEMEPSGLGDVQMKYVTNTTSKIEGFEKVDGYECLRISSQTTGTIGAEGETMGSTATMKGDISGTGTSYFAYKEGLLVKSLGDAELHIDIQIGGDQGLKIKLDIENEGGIKLTTPASL